jgi:predicted HicB family RNase H-like nuclease
MKPNKKNLVVTLDEDMHHRLKVYCAEQKITIKEFIERIIIQETKKEKERN